ncbi:MAG: DMT family transporter [Erysipelotrichaceae bacterium]
MKRTHANMILVIIAIVWGGGFIATQGALDGFTPMWMMTIRFFVAGSILLCFSYKQIITLNKHTIFKGIIAGFLLFCAFAFQTIGIQYTTASKSAFLTATNVIFVPYLLWGVMKRKPKRKEIIASIACMVGVALLTLDGSGFSLSKGDFLTIICAMFFSLHMIAIEQFSNRIPALALTCLQLLTAGFLSLIFAIPFESVPSNISSSAFQSLLFLIFLSTLFAYLLQTIAQKYTSANTTALILSMEALFACLFAYLFLKERMSISMIIGGVIIFASVVWMEWRKKV